jgi:hypothetical protein
VDKKEPLENDTRVLGRLQKKYFKMVGIKNPMSLEKLAWCEKKK